MSRPEVRCVVLADRHHRVMEGVRSLLETTFYSSRAPPAIRAALKGETFITPALAAEVQKDAQHRPRDTNEARTSDVPSC